MRSSWFEKMITEESAPVNVKKMGRPLRDFDRKIFEGLCGIQCTVDEIEKVFHTDQRTLDKWCLREYEEPFSTVYKEYAVDGKISVRRWQFKHMEKSYAMAMFLGKVYLGQRETPIGETAPNDALMTIIDQLTKKNYQQQIELDALKSKAS